MKIANLIFMILFVGLLGCTKQTDLSTCNVCKATIAEPTNAQLAASKAETKVKKCHKRKHLWSQLGIEN